MEKYSHHWKVGFKRLAMAYVAWACVLGARHCVASEEPTAVEIEFFERHVRPLLAEHCYECHSVNAKKLQAELLVDSRASLLAGGESGAALVPGDPDSSMLIEAVRYASYEMPPKGKLPAEDIEALERWVKMGAPWPSEEGPKAVENRPKFDLQSRRSEHWVWQPIRSPELPAVADSDWPNNDIDHFVLAELEEARLQPSADTDRASLLRRLYFDLIGLPPTPQQVHAFLADREPGAVERAVDQLLESPHFGERWGRHWLDLVRYAESRGHEFDNDSTNAFQYRDYVIRMLNADVPYDQIVREHIAGDLLESPRLHPTEGFNESVLGTGYWFLGEWVHSPVDIRKDEADRFDNMIDVMSKAFLGVTVACARCHDHKFDAISTADYYSLSGFLQSSDYRQVRFESLEHNRRIATRLAEVDTQYRESIVELLDQNNAVSDQPVFDEFVMSSDSIVVDYRMPQRAQFLQDGFLFGGGPRRAGEVYLASVDGKSTIQLATRGGAVNDAFWNGLESISEKGVKNRSKLFSLPRAGRTLRTPTFELADGNVICRVRGDGHVVACVDSHRLVAGPLHGETIRKIKPGSEWVKLNLSRYVGHRLHLEFTPAEGKTLEVSFVMQGASQELQTQLEKEAAELEDMIRQRSDAVAKLLAAGGNESNRLTRLIDDWAKERTALQSQILHRSRLAMAMMDGTGEDDHVLIRGNSSKPGKMVPRRLIPAAGVEPRELQSQSGRLELARQINARSNPLTARVIVNRIWHYLMGRGIVPTTDDFGVLGQRPSHPELLDHLATGFVRDQQSIKRMIRYIVLSRTYQMSSRTDARAVESDPMNMLWHHRPPKRLDGEVIRDSMLFLSGRLDATQFGEPVPIHLTPFMDGRGRPGNSGPLDGDGRRSIYSAVRRNFLSPFMLAFDTPVPFSTMGRRNVSNVPSQALILMNDPFVVEQAQGWAKRAIESHQSSESRVDWMYNAAFGRTPTQKEAAVAMHFVNMNSEGRGQPNDDVELWTAFAHALINTKEFIYLR